MTEKNKALVRRFLEELDRDGVPPANLVTDDFTIRFPGSPALTFAEYAVASRNTYAALRGLRHQIESLVAEGDRVVYRSSNTSVHTGELMGAAPTGNDVALTAIGEFRIEGGRIAEGWVEMDTLSLMRQIGATLS